MSNSIPKALLKRRFGWTKDVSTPGQYSDVREALALQIFGNAIRLAQLERQAAREIKAAHDWLNWFEKWSTGVEVYTPIGYQNPQHHRMVTVMIEITEVTGHITGLIKVWTDYEDALGLASGDHKSPGSTEVSRGAW